MRVDILFPQLPPVHDAIGEHNRALAVELARQGVEVGLLHASRADPQPVEGVELIRLSGTGQRGLATLPSVVADRARDWLVTGYNPFSYGRHGVNPALVWALHRSRRIAPGTRQGLFVHEPFVPAGTAKLAMMAAGQRTQLWALGRMQHLVACSTEVWAERFATWWPGTPTRFFAIGSNLPTSALSRTEARARLGISQNAMVLGCFGGLAHARSTTMLVAALRAAVASADHGDVAFLHVGPGSAIAQQVAEQAAVPVYALGRLEASAAADALAALDVGLAPFTDGVSARRGSFLALLQQGAATVTTHGPLVGEGLRAAAGQGAFVLAEPTPAAFAAAVSGLARDPGRRSRTSAIGRSHAQERHGWSRVAADLVELLDGSGDIRSRCGGGSRS